jgi:hypothetical protein
MSGSSEEEMILNRRRFRDPDELDDEDPRT